MRATIYRATIYRATIYRATIRWVLLLVALTVPGYHLRSQVPHAYEPPPRLKETSVPGPLSSAFALRAPGRQNCDPQGSVVRNGNIVGVALHLIRADFTINNPDLTDPNKAGKNGEDRQDPVTLRSYGGCKSGPLLEVFPGNTLRVNLINSLDKVDPSCMVPPPSGLSMPAGVGCFNTTNLHTHGLHVSPSGNSDNVLLNINPQTEFPYEINIPADHPAGTFWFHAHRHGSTAVQVSSGEAGVLVVRGNRAYPNPNADIDTVLYTASPSGQRVPIPEKFFMFQQIAYACFDNTPIPGGPWQNIYTTQGLYNANSPSTPTSPANAPWICPKAEPGKNVSRGVIENFALQLDSPTIWDTNGRFTSVNGIVQPTITVPAGEIQRWRFVHAGIHDTINVQVVRSKAQNGVQLTGNRQQQAEALKRACPSTPETSGIALSKLIPQFEIAVDGLTRTKMRTMSGVSASGSIGSNYLQPGYRSDVLIVFPEDGDYCLLDQAAPATERANNGGRGQGPGGQGPSTPQLLAYVHVQGGHAVKGNLETYVHDSLYAGNKQLPEPVRLGLKNGDTSPWAPFKELPPAPPGNLQHANFSITGNGPLFQINGASYDPDVINITRQVNTTDDWLLTSDYPNPEPHIFHIHVNPFEIVDVTHANASGQQESIFDAEGKCKPSMGPDPQGLVNEYCSLYHVFRDTVFVENGYQVHARTHYDRYIGEFVLHCHILDHEDGGMMLNIQIVPDLSAPGYGLGMPGMKHPH